MKTKTIKRILSSFLALWLSFGFIAYPTLVSVAAITATDTSIVTTLSNTKPNCLVNTIGKDSKNTRVITWQMPDSVDTGKVRYGKAENKLTETKDADIIHNNTAGNSNTMIVSLEGLTPGGTYYYQAGGTDNNWSEVYSFTTDGGGDFSFIQVTDTQDSIKLGTEWNNFDAMAAAKKEHYHIWGKALSKILADSSYSDASFLMETGDLIEVQNDITEGENEYRWLLNNTDIKDVLGNYAYFPVMGNHDSYSSAPLFHQFFTTPNKANFATDGVTNNIHNSEANYSFDYGKAHFIVINSESLFNQTDIVYKTPLDYNDPQVKAVQDWLINDLQKNENNPDTKWTIVSCHRELFGTSGRASDAERTYNAFWKILSDYGVDLILQGHSHTYMKTYPQVDNGTGISVNAVSGVVAIECGGSGIKQGPEFSTVYDYIDILDQTGIKQPTYNYITVKDDKITVKPVYVDNMGMGTVVQAFDHIEIPYTFKPETLTLTPGSNTSEINLTWYANTDSGNRAEVQFSTDPMFVNGVKTASSSAVDNATTGKKYYKANVTGLDHDTTYYYRVSNDGANYSKIYTYKTPVAG